MSKKNKKNNTTRKKGGAVIDSGGFGCILKPALKCAKIKIKREQTKKEAQEEYNGNRDNRITKLLKIKYAEKEYKEILKYKPLLERIPNYSDYFLIDGFQLCQPTPLKTEDLVDFDKKCSALKKIDINESNVNDSLDKLMAINMPYGGIDVSEYIENYSGKGKEDKLVELNNKLMDLLEKGILPMNAKHVYHCDLKASNILVDEDSKMYTRVIDWGLSMKYDPNNPIPETMLNRPFQYNVPFSNILFTDLFDTMYKKFLKSNKEDEITYHTIRVFVINYVLAWTEKRGPGHLKTINNIFKELFEKDIITKKDDSVANDNIIQFEFTFYFIFEYLTQILLKFTDKKKKSWDKMKYFNKVFIHNIDIWGFVSIYIPILEYLYSNYENLSPLQVDIVLQLKGLMLILLEYSDKPINITSIKHVLHELTDSLPYLNSRKRKYVKKGEKVKTSDDAGERFSAGSIPHHSPNTKKLRKKKFHKMIVKTLKNIKSLHSRNEWM